jgi:hypothetical protein
MDRRIPLALIYGTASGAMLGTALQAFLPGPQFSLTYSLPLQEMLRIFIFNSFLATLIVFGGTAFSLIELRFHSCNRAYKALDRTVNPLYFILKRISPGYEKLGPLWRSLYLALSFPLICMFLIAFTISLYLTAIMLLLGPQGLEFSLKLIPHISLEVAAFSYAAKTILDNSLKLKKPILQKSVASFKNEAKKILGSRKIWKRLLLLYSILLLAAVLEKFFVEL